MNILFLTLGNVNDLSANEIYPDLLREFRDNHHNVYIACGREKRQGLPTELCTEEGIQVLRVRIGNITRTNLIEKGISTLTVERCFRKAIDRWFKHVKFDLIAYSTPPITFSSLIRYLKRRDGARTYLMLKDIFPQNAVDLGMFGKKSPIYLYFRHRERALYQISDRIGCMSQANMRYVAEHNPEVPEVRIDLCPNALQLRQREAPDCAQTRRKYGIPQGSVAFLFGGNLGKPQSIGFLIDCLRKEQHREDACFVIAGSGTEYERLRTFIDSEKPQNVLLLAKLSTEDYNALTSACDVGMIFLDYRFTIPNYPSRILPYMQAEKPILAATDAATDLRKTLEDGRFGWWCPSNDVDAFDRTLSQVLSQREKIAEFGKNGRHYLEMHFDVRKVALDVLSQMKSRVLIVSQCFYPSVNRGGPAVSVTNLAKALSQKTDVSVLTASYESGSAETFSAVKEGKNRLFDCDVYYTKSQSSAELTALMRQAAPDCIYISSLFSAEYTLPALSYARRQKLHTVLAPRGELQKAALAQKRLKKLPYLAYLKLSGLTKRVVFHATSEDEAARIRKLFPQNEVCLAQNIAAQLSAPQRMRKKLPGTLSAVAVCRIHPIKGLDRALEALRTVKANVTYDIYGPVENEAYYAHCLALTEQLPDNVTVRFHGAVQAEQLPQLLTDADVFLLPTQTENFGNAIVEALQCGCPAIISDGTPWKELSVESAGVNAETSADYAAAIERFATMDEPQWCAFSDGAKTYIGKRIAVENTVHTYLKMLGGQDETAVSAH